MSKKIIILSDDIPGHLNQSRGIALLLSTQFESSISIVSMTYKFKFLRSVSNFLAKILCKIMNPFTAHIIKSFYQKIDMNQADLIIAAGGNTAPLSAALKNILCIPVIQLGSPRGLHPALFNALVTVEKYFDHPANIVVDITPNTYSPSICIDAAKSQDMQKHLLFLIGGKGIGYSYDQDDWAGLVKNICYIQKVTQLPITIVTSRRTDPLVEIKLQDELSTLPMDYSAWYHRGDKNFNLAALFGSAVSIFVTEDSAMMISESISSGQPVTTLYPSNIKSPLRYQKHLQKYEEASFISRESIKNFSYRESSDVTIRIENHSASLKKKLIERIQW